jgi:hypothetical protein
MERQQTISRTLARGGQCGSAAGRRSLLQRKCACGGAAGMDGECAECRSKRLQRRSAGQTEAPSAQPGVPPIVHEVLRSSGRPLEPATQALMASRFGHDFGGVRVHTDARAAESARAVNALAYAVGRNVVFAQGQYAPGTSAGRQLLAHELAHVIQQSAGPLDRSTAVALDSPESEAERAAQRAARSVVAGEAAPIAERRGGLVQRDLATPAPTPAPPAQPDLTEAQIRDALRFNRARYDEANTRLIQDILGGPVTGQWTRENILAIAATQEEYGLTKDGKVGADTFRFIVEEQRLEGADTADENCLTMFRVVVHPVQTAATAGPRGTTQIRGHHVVDAQFSSRCNCSEFQYRQFIAGVATGSRSGASQDLSNLFANIPGGRLPTAFREDGMTQCAGVNYGHREQPAQEQTTTRCGENRYLDDAGATDQANGCIYRGEDFPTITVNGLNTGDDVDLLVEFRGEIQRNGRTVQTKRWTTVDTTVRTP